MRAEYVIGEAATNLRRNVLLVLGAILAVFVSLFMTYMALVVNEVARNSAERWQEGISIIAWLDDADLADHTLITNEVAGWDEVKRAVYVGKAESWQEFQTMFADQSGPGRDRRPGLVAGLGPGRAGRQRDPPGDREPARVDSPRR